MSNVDNQISRMITMMNYGLQTESKNPYSTVEYHRVGADGKMYGIVREGTKYYIKVSNTTKGDILKENFEYLGGFVNRSRNEFTSYASALKHFDQKMNVIKENYETKNVITEAWNPNAKNQVMEEATDAMRKEIARQRQIMSNASRIAENKACECDGAPFCDDACEADDMDGIKASQKSNIKGATKPVVGKGAKLKESEVLGWNDEKDYMDTTHGTHIGDSAPFDKNANGDSKAEMKDGVVEEESEKKDWASEGLPANAGVGEVGDDDPFTEKAKKGLKEADEADEDLDDVEGDDTEEDFDDVDAEDTDVDDFDAEGDDADVDDFDEEGVDDVDADTEDFDDDFDSDLDDTEDEIDDEDFDNDLESRIENIENILDKIADKLGIDEFEDDTLYDDDNADDFDDEADDTEADDSLDFDVEMGDDDMNDDEEDSFDEEGDDFSDDDMEDDDFSDDDEDDDTDVYESRSYRRMKRINEENRLDYFGKHPAWRKQPMKLPHPQHTEKQGYYDMNDDSVKNEKPYAKQIGDSAPFKISPEAIDNAIAEAINRVNRRNK